MRSLMLVFLLAPATWGEQNKTKRGLIHESTYYGESNPNPFRPVTLYHHDNNPSPSQQNYYSNKPEPKVTSQQVLYEYQQTPLNAVSNVHVNQQFQNAPVTEPTYPQPYVQQPSQYVPAGTVVNPVQHSTYIHHTPYIPQPQNPHFTPAKYVYVNNKVMYQQPQPIQTHPLARPYKLPAKFQPAPILPPLPYQNYHQTTTVKPTIVTTTQKQEIKKVIEDEEDEDEDEEEDEEVDDDEEERAPFGRYRFEEDDVEEDEDKEDDDDSDRGSSSYRTQKPKHSKYSTSYRYKEGYKTKSNYDQKRPTKKAAFATKKHHRKPEPIQGKSSQQIPVTVKKVYREKWYISKNSDKINH